MRGAGPGRAVSPIRFFDPILNNALALRASHKECASISQIFTNFRRKLQVFKKGVRLNFTDFHKFSSKLASFQIRSAPQFHRFSPIFVETCQFSNKECASVSLIFTNFRRKLPVFKKEVRLNFTDFHNFSSKIVHFQIKHFVDSCQISKEK